MWRDGAAVHEANFINIQSAHGKKPEKPPKWRLEHANELIAKGKLGEADEPTAPTPRRVVYES